MQPDTIGRLFRKHSTSYGTEQPVHLAVDAVGEVEGIGTAVAAADPSSLRATLVMDPGERNSDAEAELEDARRKLMPLLAVDWSRRGKEEESMESGGDDGEDDIDVDESEGDDDDDDDGDEEAVEEGNDHD